MTKKSVLAFLMLPMLLVGCGNSDKPTTKPSAGTSDTAKQSTAQPTAKPNTDKPTEASKTTPTSTPTGEKTTTFVMEAEYTNLDGKSGNGYSGGAQGVGMIQKDEGGKAQASNGYWVGYLYHTNITLDFVFNSDKAVENVSLIMRLTCEIKDVTLTSDNYKIFVNDEEMVDYGTITLSGASSSDSDNYIRPFTDFKCRKKMNLKAGENKIVFQTANTENMGGTMNATAPMFDCVKITDFGDANLSYTPLTSNLDLLDE